MGLPGHPPPPEPSTPPSTDNADGGPPPHHDAPPRRQAPPPGSLSESRQASSASGGTDTTPTGRDDPILVDRRGSVASIPQTGSSRGPSSDWQSSHISHATPGPGSDISDDRVFPIRSVVSVDPTSPKISRRETQPVLHGPDTPIRRPSHHRGHASMDSTSMPPSPGSSRYPTPKGRREGVRSEHGSIRRPGAERYRPDAVIPLQQALAASDGDSEESGALAPERNAEAPVEKGQSISSFYQDSSFSDMLYATIRFTHIMSEDGHPIITGHTGTLERREDEPIHIPGSVQGFGCLVAIREGSDGSFAARYVSENSARFLGYTPQQLFRLKDFMDIFTEEQQDNLLDHIDFIRDEDADPTVNGPEVFNLSIRHPKGRSVKLWCAVHINPAHPDLIICEIELVDDQLYPTRPSAEPTPETSRDTLWATSPVGGKEETSAEVLTKPLRILRSARRRRGDHGAMQVFDIMSQVQEQLSSAQTLEALLKVLVSIVKELTGFHRVMMYQFDSSFNGKVVAELVDSTQTKDLYHGLHFPASDIPAQARDLYRLNKVHLMYDRELKPARIVCRAQEDLEIPLDMSHAYLRSISLGRLKYLANMSVRSSMSISLIPFDDLWGLVSCHSYGNQGMRVPFPIRKMCRLVGDTASRNIERLSYASRLQARKLINTAPTDKNPSGYIIASSDDLLRLFDADFGLLSITGETKILGTIEHSQEALAMMEYLRRRQITSVVASRDIDEDFPDLKYPPGFKGVAGLLYVPLSVGGSDFIVLFRKGQVREVKWAGNPYEVDVREGTIGYLEPRKSFEPWTETVVGKSREWSEEQVETASVLCLVYGKFIEVWRQKEQAIQSSKLTRLLLSNSAHEVRTPLNAIINYLEIALEGAVDQETRDNLARSYSASKSLIYVINDLLDLTNTEEGHNLVKDEVFDLHVCIEEATEPFRNDTRRKNLDYQVVQHSGLPRFVHGDSRRVRQAISNMTANAVEHTREGFVRVEIYVVELRDDLAVVDFVVTDSGIGMSSHQLDSLFHDLEQVSPEEPTVTPMPSPGMDRNPAASRTLGLGLAIVARTVRNMNGQLRLKSDEGIGSRFVVQIPFHLPESPPTPQIVEGQDDPSSSSMANSASQAPLSLTTAPDGEIMLVDHGADNHLANGQEHGKHVAVTDRDAGAPERFDGGLNNGSHRSDAERLIDAIQTPLSIDNRELQYPSSRHSSKGNSATPPRTSSDVPGSPHSRRLPPSTPTHRRNDSGGTKIRDSKTPVHAVTIPDENVVRRQASQRTGSPVSISRDIRPRASTDPYAGSVSSLEMTEAIRPLHVLIAEDDPVNMKIMCKRLERSGHDVHQAVNGEDCAALYKEQSHVFDAVLMDMQMPIVDGITSTQMIRSFEASGTSLHSELAKTNGRIPIFAVSASLIEDKKQTYIDAGFDGWILKPIDFRRLNTLLAGIYNPESRFACLYEPGEWERGGWLLRTDTH